MTKTSKSRSLFTLLFLFLAFSCNNEPVEEGTDLNINGLNNDDLLGEWNLSEFYVTLNSIASFENQTTISDVDIISTNVAYILEFDTSTFSTNGNYSYDVDIDVNGINSATDSYTLDNVSGMGTYLINENEMTIDGSFFEFNIEGIDNASSQGEQTVDFELADDGETLTFTQNNSVTQTDELTGTIIMSTTNSTSVWTRDEAQNTCDLQAATNEAELAFNQDDTNESLCNGYKLALENQIAECGDIDGNLQALIDDLGDCSFSNMGEPGSLVVTAGTLFIDFINQNISLQEGVIIVDATNSTNNYFLYFEVVEGATGINALQNFVITFNGTDYFPSTQGVDDFESETTVSSQGIFIATFSGFVESAAGADLSLTLGMADLNY